MLKWRQLQILRCAGRVAQHLQQLLFKSWLPVRERGNMGLAEAHVAPQGDLQLALGGACCWSWM